MNESHVKFAKAHDWVGDAWLEDGALIVSDIAYGLELSFDTLNGFREYAGY